MKNLYKALALAGAMTLGAVSFAEGVTDSGQSISKDSVVVYVSNGEIIVKGAENADVSAYSLNGAKVDIKNAKGMVIVVIKDGETTVTKKVVVK